MKTGETGCECPRGIRRLRADSVTPEPIAEFRHEKVSPLSPVDRARYWSVALLWLAVNVAFWGWWLHQTDHSTAWLYWAETIALFYQTTRRRIGSSS
jgi:hypothetical protein